MGNSKLTTRITHSPQSYFKVEQHAQKTEKKHATICADIVKAAARGDLVWKDTGDSFFR